VVGSALHVPLPKDLRVGSSVYVKIYYATTKDSTALQWLTPELVNNFHSDFDDIDTLFQGKRRAKNIHISLVNVSLSTLAQWHRSKVIIF